MDHEKLARMQNAVRIGVSSLGSVLWLLQQVRAGPEFRALVC